MATGKILLLTGVTMVRVEDLQRDGNNLTITAGPVGLPDVITNGDLTWSSQTVDFTGARILTWDNIGAQPGGAATTVPPAGLSQDQQRQILGGINGALGGGGTGSTDITTSTTVSPNTSQRQALAPTSRSAGGEAAEQRLGPTSIRPID